ncbi:MAG: DUF4129 domain-containing protein, partial [Flavobacterium sp.]
FFAQQENVDSIVKAQDSIFVNEAKVFAPNFKEKYQSKAFEYEPKIEVNSTWEQFKSWLKNLLEKLFGLSKEADDWVNTILEIGAVILILLVIYFITKALLNKEGQWIFGKSAKSVISDDNIEYHLHQTNFEQLINEKLNQKDFRLAIRYYYLYLLKKMSDQNIISWELNKTNSDYLYEIKNEVQKNKFEKLSYLFEYIWYGEFKIDEIQYLQAIQEFKNALKTYKNE